MKAPDRALAAKGHTRNRHRADDCVMASHQPGTSTSTVTITNPSLGHQRQRSHHERGDRPRMDSRSETAQRVDLMPLGRLRIPARRRSPLAAWRCLAGAGATAKGRRRQHLERPSRGPCLVIKPLGSECTGHPYIGLPGPPPALPSTRERSPAMQDISAYGIAHTWWQGLNQAIGLVSSRGRRL